MLVIVDLAEPPSTKIHCDLEILTSVRILEDMRHKSARAIIRNRGLTAAEVVPADASTGLIADLRTA